MKKLYKIERLEDLPKFIPIIFIKDNHFKDSKPIMVGNDIHDQLVVEPGGNFYITITYNAGKVPTKIAILDL